MLPGKTTQPNPDPLGSANAFPFVAIKFSYKQIPHTGDKASLDRCGQQHRCHRRVDQGKISKKKKKICAAILDHFQTKMFKFKTTSYQYFSPRIRISKNIGHPTLGSGGKKTVKWYLKNEKSEGKKNFFLRGDFRQFSNKNVHI